MSSDRPRRGRTGSAAEHRSEEPRDGPRNRRRLDGHGHEAVRRGRTDCALCGKQTNDRCGTCDNTPPLCDRTTGLDGGAACFDLWHRVWRLTALERFAAWRSRLDTKVEKNHQRRWRNGRRPKRGRGAVGGSDSHLFEDGPVGDDLGPVGDDRHVPDPKRRKADSGVQLPQGRGDVVQPPHDRHEHGHEHGLEHGHKAPYCGLFNGDEGAVHRARDLVLQPLGGVAFGARGDPDDERQATRQEIGRRVPPPQGGIGDVRPPQGHHDERREQEAADGWSRPMVRSACEWDDELGTADLKLPRATRGRSALRVTPDKPMAEWSLCAAKSTGVTLPVADLGCIATKGYGGVLTGGLRSAVVYLPTGNAELAEIATRELSDTDWRPYRGLKAPHGVPVLLTYKCQAAGHTVRHTVLAYQFERGGPVYLFDSWPFCFGDPAKDRRMMEHFVYAVCDLFDVDGYTNADWKAASTFADEDVATEEDGEGNVRCRQRLGGPVRHVCPQLQHHAGRSCTMYCFAWMIDIVRDGRDAAEQIARGDVVYDESAMRRHTWSILRDGIVTAYPRLEDCARRRQ